MTHKGNKWTKSFTKGKLALVFLPRDCYLLKMLSDLSEPRLEEGMIQTVETVGRTPKLRKPYKQ